MTTAELLISQTCHFNGFATIEQRLYLLSAAMQRPQNMPNTIRYVLEACLSSEQGEQGRVLWVV